MPVINGLTDRTRPCQVLADLQTCHRLGDRIGHLAAGYDADLIAVGVPAEACGDEAAPLDALLVSHATEPVRNVPVRGRRAV